MLDFIGYFFLVSGSLITFIAAIGFTKFKGFFNKVHASGINDVFGCLVSLIGLVFLDGFSSYSLKILLLILVILLTSPTSTYALSLLNSNKENYDE